MPLTYSLNFLVCFWISSEITAPLAPNLFYLLDRGAIIGESYGRKTYSHVLSSQPSAKTDANRYVADMLVKPIISYAIFIPAIFLYHLL
jgi:hypothetical protein